ncbi:flagellar hook-basal body complex protein FliE [Moellerella wisconsensis]|uniref:Flagellar hook-basal body complex protein FliE n=1 Tax=Moellerella wisconsensis ATCC 35017 TaxID=1354267 RepID=A0A0N0Z977_9GAMM|nr:flagellar hook-basal body complex protein FliE [Moellerella wisconsensis]KPD02317.1 FliE family flagellar hook-basal body complex protein [Moellerella wisconsensis ATCC 35017]UNH28400.1 flagellar hook-basal body complex protein FliE [Moellerella wisconsensis]VFS53977.1 Flagellar hook-basal body complex protein FliE [Moellerella wisconsensis]
MAISAIDSIGGLSINKLEPISMLSAPVTGANNEGFSAQLVNAIKNVDKLQNNATQKARLFTQEVPNVELSDVMVDSQKATISLQFAVQVRNKLVSAYQEVMNMQI